jgi:hypothetical protein
MDFGFSSEIVLLWIGGGCLFVGCLVLLIRMRQKESFSEKYGVPLLIFVGFIFVYLSLNPGAMISGKVGGNEFVLQSQFKEEIKVLQNEADETIQNDLSDKLNNINNQFTKIGKTLTDMREKYEMEISNLNGVVSGLQELLKVKFSAKDVNNAVQKAVNKKQEKLVVQKNTLSLSVEVTSLNARDLQDDIDGDVIQFHIKDLLTGEIVDTTDDSYKIDATGFKKINYTFKNIKLRNIEDVERYVLKMNIKWKGSWRYFGTDYKFRRVALKDDFVEATNVYRYKGWVSSKNYEVNIKYVVTENQ